MSDNVVPLFGDPPQKKHLSFRKQWIIFITIVVLIFVVLFWYLLSQTTALDGVKRFFGASENDYRDIGFTLYGQSDFALVGESFAVVSQSGLQVFDVDGQMLLELSDSLMKPAVITSEGYGLMYDLGGTRAVLFDADGEILFDKRMPGRIFDASLCQEGLCALLYEGENCFTAFEVYDEEGEKRYAHHSSSAFLNTCALSPDGDNAVVGTLGQQDISFLSTARVLKPHSEGIKATYSFGTELVCALGFLGEENIFAIGEETVFFFDIKGEKQAEHTIPWGSVRSFAVCEELLFVLYEATDKNRGCALMCFDGEGNVLSTVEAAPTARQLSASENYVCLTDDEFVSIYDVELNLRSRTANNGCLTVLARDDGTALCVGSNGTELFIP